MISNIALLCVLSSIVATSQALRRLPHFKGPLVANRIATPDPAPELSELPVVDNVLRLTKTNGTSLSAIMVETMRTQSSGRPPFWERVTASNTNLKSIGSGVIYMAPITIGGQSFYSVIDTGSSDPWVASTGFDCVDPYDFSDRPEDQSYFGNLYDPTRSTSFTNIPNINMNLSYADGEVLTGIFGRDAYTMAGITVPDQQFGLVNFAAWYGDTYSSGLTGFAYSSLTNSYAGTDPHADNRYQPIHYNPLFANMVAQGLAPIFSMALSRDPNEGGIMALGGVPDVPRSQHIASTPIKPLGLDANGQLYYQYYTITIDGFAYAPPSERISAQFYPDPRNPTSNPNYHNLDGPGTNVIIDSGTSLVLTPDAIAARVLAMFDPPGTYDASTLTWMVDCDAKPPVFGVSIAGKIFYTNPADMILQNSATTCISGVQNNLGELTLLGDVWMRNVLAIFDLGAQRMGFAARPYYNLENYDTN